MRSSSSQHTGICDCFWLCYQAMDLSLIRAKFFPHGNNSKASVHEGIDTTTPMRPNKNATDTTRRHRVVLHVRWRRGNGWLQCQWCSKTYLRWLHNRWIGYMTCFMHCWLWSTETTRHDSKWQEGDDPTVFRSYLGTEHAIFELIWSWQTFVKLGLTPIWQLLFVSRQGASSLPSFLHWSHWTVVWTQREHRRSDITVLPSMNPQWRLYTATRPFLHYQMRRIQRQQLMMHPQDQRGPPTSQRFIQILPVHFVFQLSHIHSKQKLVQIGLVRLLLLLNCWEKPIVEQKFASK